MPPPEPQRARGSQGLRLATDFGPLIVFFAVNYQWGILAGTAALMAAVAVAFVITLAVERRVPVMACVTAGLVLVFGGLTVLLEDELFIKLKPTVVNLLFAAALAVGLLLRRNFIRLVMGHAIAMTDHGWRLLTRFWIAAFLCMAAANEVAWRALDTDGWVNFKVFGLPGILFLFILAMMPVMHRHRIADPGEAAGTPPGR